MKETVRVTLIRITLVVATFVSVMGYNFTRNLVFIPLPLLAGLVLIYLVRRAPVQDYTRHAARRNGLVQLGASCAMLTAFAVVSTVRHWGTRDIVGFWIMLGEVLVLALLAFIWYTRHRDLVRKRAPGGDLTSDSLKRSTRIHPD